MSLRMYIAKKIGGIRIAHCLTGEIEELRRLTALRNVPIDNPGLKAFMRELARDCEDESGMARLFVLLGKLLNPRSKKKLIENLIFNWAVEGQRIRVSLASKEYWVPILEAANSPFFKAIRREYPYNEEGNLKRPCMIIDNPESLRKLVKEHLVPQGHEKFEDITCDPEVVNWVDEYAQAFKRLVDPIWLRMIEDPSCRWYKEGQEYRNLFRFKQSDKPVVPERATSGIRKKPPVR